MNDKKTKTANKDESIETLEERKRKKALKKQRKESEEESFFSEMLEDVEVDAETYELLKKLK